MNSWGVTHVKVLVTQECGCSWILVVECRHNKLDGGGGGGGGSEQKFRIYMWVEKCSKTQKFKGTFVHRRPRGGCTFFVKKEQKYKATFGQWKLIVLSI